MRIIVIKISKSKNNYTTCIHSLIEEIGRRHNYKIKSTDSFKESTEANNTIIFITLPQATSITKILQQHNLRSFIVKNKIDLLIQSTGFIITQKIIPQLLIADDINHLPAIKKISDSSISLLVYSIAAKQTITNRGLNNHVHVIPFFAGSMYQPINWSMKQQVKIDYTEGREYFFVIQSFHTMEDIVQLLKAFSGFKKWQKSSMKLVLAGKLYLPKGDLEEKLDSYKYREDVLVQNNLLEEDKARLLAGAYACIHLPKKDNEVLPLLQSIQCQTPVITIDTPTVREFVADAGLYTTYSNDEITKQMILIYKDEKLLSKLQENCTLEAEKFSQEKALQMLQPIIQLSSKTVEL